MTEPNASMLTTGKIFEDHHKNTSTLQKAARTGTRKSMLVTTNLAVKKRWTVGYVMVRSKKAHPLFLGWKEYEFHP